MLPTACTIKFTPLRMVHEAFLKLTTVLWHCTFLWAPATLKARLTKHSMRWQTSLSLQMSLPGMLLPFHWLALFVIRPKFAEDFLCTRFHSQNIRCINSTNLNHNHEVDIVLLRRKLRPHRKQQKEDLKSGTRATKATLNNYALCLTRTRAAGHQPEP